MTRVRGFALSALLTVAAASGCAEDAQFNVQYAPGFVPAKAPSVSVLGIFKDGRLNAEAWPDIGPGLSSSLCKGGCEALYMPGKEPSVTTSKVIEAFARDNGVTDDLLGELAPFADGDGIMLITVAGKPPRQTPDAADKKKAASAPPSQTGRRGARGMGAMGGASPLAMRDTSVYQVSAMIYSKAERKSVAMIDMAYTGPSIDDALKRFAERISKEIPSVKGVGWKGNVVVDAAKLKKLSEDVPSAP